MKYKINGNFKKMKNKIGNRTDNEMLKLNNLEIKGRQGACVSDNNYKKKNSIMDYYAMYRRIYQHWNQRKTGSTLHVSLRCMYWASVQSDTPPDWFIKLKFPSTFYQQMQKLHYVKRWIN